MKYFLLISTILLLSFFSKAQFIFNKLYNNSNNHDGGFSVVQTFDNGFISVGGSYGTNSGLYIVRTSANGDTLWQKYYNFSPYGADDGNSVIQLGDSSFSICGSRHDSSEQATDVYLLRLSVSGNVQWYKPINAGYNDRGVMHKQTSDGGFIIGGYFNVSKGKIFLIKTDNSGNVQWQHQYAADTLGNFLQSIDVSADGGFVLGGYNKNSTTLKNHLFLIKTDSAGNEKWVKSYGDSTCQEYKGYVISTLDKGFVQVGYRRNIDQTSFRYIIKTDSNGIVQWEKLFGWPLNNDVFKVVRQLPDSSYVVAGGFRDTIHSNTRPRILLLKLNKYGDSIWAKTYTYYGGGYQFGSVADDYVEDLNLTSDGGFILCGYIINNFMPGKNDLLLIKTDSLGNTCVIDTITYEGCSYQECSYTQAAFTVSSDTIDLQYTDTIHFYSQSIFVQHWFWNFGDGHIDTIQNPLHVFDTTGTFHVMLVTSFNECSDTIYKTVVVVNSVGINQSINIEQSEYTIFPNPAIDKIKLMINSNDFFDLSFYNIQGVLLFQYLQQSKQIEFPVSQFENGIYLLKINSPNYSLVKKIIISK